MAQVDGDRAVGRHRRRLAEAVFVDGSGRRMRVARRVTYLGVGVCALLVAAAVLSLLGGVPVPGVRPPARLPNQAQAAKHVPTLARQSPTAVITSAIPSAHPSPFGPPTFSQGAAPPLTTLAPSAPATPGPARSAQDVASTAGSSSSVATASASASPSPSVSAVVHSPGPPVTPPGRTKSPQK